MKYFHRISSQADGIRSVAEVSADEVLEQRDEQRISNGGLEDQALGRNPHKLCSGLLIVMMICGQWFASKSCY